MNLKQIKGIKKYLWRKERFKDMEELFEKFEFNESTTCNIKEINGV